MSDLIRDRSETDVKADSVSMEISVPATILGRISLILDALDCAGSLTLSNVVERTGIPRSSAHRLLEQLVRMRWIRRTDRRYQLGFRLMELGVTAIRQDRLRSASEAVLQELYRSTGFVVQLAVLDGPDVIVLEKLGGRLAASVSTCVGDRRPAHTIALGRALLAFSEAEPIVSAGYGCLLQEAADHGVVYELAKDSDGLNCVAVPIGPVGEVLGAISICGPASHLLCDHRFAAPVRKAAASIWTAIQRDTPDPALMSSLMNAEGLQEPIRYIRRRRLSA